MFNMTSIDEHLENYFSSLNPITRKICNDLDNVKKAYGEEEWNRLGPVQQEEVLARYMISDDVRDKYSCIEKGPTPEVFPKIKINCGEKIVVDFENDDGWTWQDEHSGPFSWMTRSQQDLTLDDLDNLDEQMKKSKRGKSRSPDREGANKRQWDTSYDGTNTEAANTADEIFQKFGIAFSFGKNEEDTQENDTKGLMAEELELLSGEENTNFVTGEDAVDFYDRMSDFESSLKDDTLSDVYACSDVSSQWTSTASSTSSKKKKEKSLKPISSEKSEAELCLMDDPLEYNSIYGGQLSPVYIEQFGESTTDPDPTDSLNSSRFNYHDVDVQSDTPSVLGIDPSNYESSTISVICEQPTAPQPLADDQTWPINGLDEEISNVHPEPQPTESSSPVRTGFDFLDNW